MLFSRWSWSADPLVAFASRYDEAEGLLDPGMGVVSASGKVDIAAGEVEKIAVRDSADFCDGKGLRKETDLVDSPDPLGFRPELMLDGLERRDRGARIDLLGEEGNDVEDPGIDFRIS